MATSEAIYSKVPADVQESQRPLRSGVSKWGIALLGGSCLVLLSIRAISTSGIGSTTSLIGVSRATSPTMLQTTTRLLPGANPWKELALAGIEQANRCSRDVSLNANPVMSVLSRMDSKSKAAVNVVVRAAATKKPEEILKAGATAPFGFWDPLGFSTDVPEGRLLFYREVELKHGRVCMLASLGFFVGEKFHPLFGGNIDVPSYVAFQATPLQDFWLAAAAAVALPEILASIPTFNEPSDFGDWAFTMKSDRVPGDLGFDPLGLKPKSEKDFLELQNKELNNGRLAMFAITGMIGQELATGKALR